MRIMSSRSRRLRAAVVGAAVAGACLVLGHGALAVDSTFTQTCATGSPLDIHTISVTNDATTITYGVTMCNNFTTAQVSRIVWQFSFADIGGASAPVDGCMSVEPSHYTGANHNAVGLLAFITNRCVGGTNGLGGAPDANDGALIATAPVTQTSNSVSATFPIAALRQLGLGGANSYGLRVVARDTASQANLNGVGPQDAAPEDQNTFLTHSLTSALITQPQLSIGNAKKKLKGGSSTMSFPITLSAPSARAITVHYVTANGTATAGKDYTAEDQTLTIPANTSTGIVINIPVKHGKKGKHTFTVTLDSPTNATLVHSVATGTITDQ